MNKALISKALQHTPWTIIIYMCICDQACENQPCERKKIADFFLCSIINYELFILKNKIAVTTAEFNGLSSEIRAEDISETITRCNLRLRTWLIFVGLVTYTVNYKSYVGEKFHGHHWILS